MSDEILVRAREACVAVLKPESHSRCHCAEEYRRGDNDGGRAVSAILRFHADLGKPLSEIQPPDPDLLEARKLAAEFSGSAAFKDRHLSGHYDDTPRSKGFLAAIKRGRELERLNNA